MPLTKSAKGFHKFRFYSVRGGLTYICMWVVCVRSVRSFKSSAFSGWEFHLCWAKSFRFEPASEREMPFVALGLLINCKLLFRLKAKAFCCHLFAFHSKLDDKPSPPVIHSPPTNSKRKLKCSISFDHPVHFCFLSLHFFLWCILAWSLWPFPLNGLSWEFQIKIKFCGIQKHFYIRFSAVVQFWIKKQKPPDCRFVFWFLAQSIKSNDTSLVLARCPFWL